ncbi:hypothetical protein ACO2Q8_17320 [Larkinella sp. VNQ87]|uniref:hypothetical protein n=1 Tax=Larkinella sp. VNQ87 TaxID=3400921 RepID=UPI003C016CD7
MEINDDLEIQIFHTLEHLRRVNQNLRQHLDAEQPSSLMIEQYQAMKQRLTEELQHLMSLATEVTWQVAA